MMPHVRERSTTEDLQSRRRKVLENSTKDELIDRVLELEFILMEDTMRMTLPTGTRPFDLPWEPRDYLTIPKDGTHPAWRLVLVSFDLAHPILGFDVCSEVVVGRNCDTYVPDLDLAPLNAKDYGVSRQHALLRPVEGRLLLIDLESSNGTQVNEDILEPAEPYSLDHNDIVEFGGLKMQFRLEALVNGA